MSVETVAVRLGEHEPDDVRRLKSACDRLYSRGSERISRRSNPLNRKISRDERNTLRAEASDRTFAAVMSEWANSDHADLQEFLKSRSESRQQGVGSVPAYSKKLSQIASQAGGVSSEPDSVGVGIDWTAFLFPQLQRLFDVLFARCEV